MCYIFLGSDEKPAKDVPCTSKIIKLRRVCVNTIWRKWSNERHWGPRIGVILISTMEAGAGKVCFCREIIENRKHF